jgi:hypothetical protein
MEIQRTRLIRFVSLEKGHRERLLIFCAVCVSSATMYMEYTAQAVGESDYSVTTKVNILH